MRTLILDDDILCRTVAESYLQHLNVNDVLTTADSVEASDILHNEQIDLILLDLNMPNEDGLAVLRDLSEIGYQGGIIIVSGERENILFSSGSIGEKLGLNICATLAKPLDIEKLGRAVEIAKTHGVGKPLKQPIANSSASSKLKPVLWYQPQIEAASGRLVGAEALLRGIDDDNSVFGPQSVLTDYCDIESRFDFTMDLFDLFCRDVVEIRKAGVEIRFSFNVDATVLEFPSFVESFIDIAAAYELNPNHIVIELIEAYLPEDETHLLEVIARLSMYGFEVSMDDFSSGAASFNLLRAGAFTEIKLDMELVKNCATDAASAKFVCNAVSLAKTLKTRIIAEGIETEEELTRLAAMGVQEMQGFFFARPADKNQLKLLYPTVDLHLRKAS